MPVGFTTSGARGRPASGALPHRPSRQWRGPIGPGYRPLTRCRQGGRL